MNGEGKLLSLPALSAVFGCPSLVRRRGQDAVIVVNKLHANYVLVEGLATGHRLDLNPVLARIDGMVKRTTRTADPNIHAVGRQDVESSLAWKGNRLPGIAGIKLPLERAVGS